MGRRGGFQLIQYTLNPTRFTLPLVAASARLYANSTALNPARDLRISIIQLERPHHTAMKRTTTPSALLPSEKVRQSILQSARCFPRMPLRMHEKAHYFLLTCVQMWSERPSDETSPRQPAPSVRTCAEKNRPPAKIDLLWPDDPVT